MDQRNVDVDMLNAVKSVLAHANTGYCTATPTQTKTSSHRD